MKNENVETQKHERTSFVISWSIGNIVTRVVVVAVYVFESIAVNSCASRYIAVVPSALSFCKPAPRLITNTTGVATIVSIQAAVGIPVFLWKSFIRTVDRYRPSFSRSVVPLVGPSGGTRLSFRETWRRVPCIRPPWNTKRHRPRS